MIQILPSILTAEEKDYEARIKKIEESQAFEDGWIHVDFADNVFVPNKTLGIEALKLYPTNFHVEAHLMVADPTDWVQELIEAGVERVIIHLETIEKAPDLKSIKKQGVEVGLAINLETPVAKLTPFMDTIDLVLVMSIHPGFSGQKFLDEAREKISEIVALVKKYPSPRPSPLEKGEGDGIEQRIKIEVDGGVTAELVPELEGLGVNAVTMASHLVEGDINENLEKIWESYEQKTASGT